MANKRAVYYDSLTYLEYDGSLYVSPVFAIDYSDSANLALVPSDPVGKLEENAEYNLFKHPFSGGTVALNCDLEYGTSLADAEDWPGDTVDKCQAPAENCSGPEPSHGYGSLWNDMLKCVEAPVRQGLALNLLA